MTSTNANTSQPTTTPAQPTNDCAKLSEIAVSLRRIIAITDKPRLDDEEVICLRYEAECALKACA